MAANILASISAYAQQLGQNGFECNAIVFVITDGADNVPTLEAHNVVESMRAALSRETLKSLSSVLVGANVHWDALSLYLNRLRKEASFSD